MTATVLDALNAALRRALADDPRVLLLGEDILDPYGGAFKVTRGLSSEFPARVVTTPISEAGMVGVAAGMALRGLRPVVEIMFGDFTTLAVDQLTNHAAKFRWMYNNTVSLPLVVRAPMGGRRGYGPTHSQSLEKLFLGAPGLRVLAPTDLPGETVPQAEALLYAAITAQDDPTLFVENKLQYLLPVQTAASLAEFDLRVQVSSSPLLSPFNAPTFTLSVRGAPPPALTIAAYGYVSTLAREALLTLAYEQEIFAELVVPTQLSPYDDAALLDSLRRTGRLLVVEEGTLSFGWGAEVVARAAQALGGQLRAARRLAAAEHPVPASLPLETASVPGVVEVVRAGLQMLR